MQKKKNEKHYLYSIGQCQKRKIKNIICIHSEHVQKKQNKKQKIKK